MLSDTEFDLKWKHIREQGQARREGAVAWEDQEAARLFNTCDWTQEKIAKRIGKSQQWVSYRLIFGRFLDFTTAVVKPEQLTGLTEFRFRGYWRKTKGTEKERFAEIAAMVVGRDPMDFVPGRNTGVKKETIKVMEDGQWYLNEEIAASVEESIPGITSDQINDCLKTIRSHPPSGKLLESKEVGRRTKYRLVDREDVEEASQSDIEELLEQMGPLLDQIEKLSGMHRANTPGELFHGLATKIRRLRDEITEKVRALKKLETA